MSSDINPEVATEKIVDGHELRKKVRDLLVERNNLKVSLDNAQRMRFRE